MASVSGRKYPVVLEAYMVTKEGSDKKPINTRIVYSDPQYDSFIEFFRSQKITYEIMERKAKLKEATKLNWFQKVAYVLPFQQQFSDIIVEVIKALITFALGLWLGKQL